MCKQYTAETYLVEWGQLEKISDLRVYYDMFPNTPENMYRACLTGLWRQSN